MHVQVPLVFTCLAMRLLMEMNLRATITQLEMGLLAKTTLECTKWVQTPTTPGCFNGR